MSISVTSVNHYLPQGTSSNTASGYEGVNGYEKAQCNHHDAAGLEQ